MRPKRETRRRKKRTRLQRRVAPGRSYVDVLEKLKNIGINEKVVSSELTSTSTQFTSCFEITPQICFLPINGSKDAFQFKVSSNSQFSSNRSKF